MSHQWNATLYDHAHQFVSKYGEGIFSYLRPKEGERILDLGCGTGDLTQKIKEHGANVIGIDSSKEMIDQAKSKYPTIPFHVMDATTLSFEEPFDAIFSNAVFHWVREQEQLTQQLFNNLKTGGRMVVEFGGQDNVGNMLHTLMHTLGEKNMAIPTPIHPWYFPSIGAYSSLLEKSNFRVIHAEHFDRWTPLKGDAGMRNWFLMFGEKLFQNCTVEEKEGVLQEVENKLKEKHYQDGVWYADYRRIRIIALKE